jgi:hypothetical protein
MAPIPGDTGKQDVGSLLKTKTESTETKPKRSETWAVQPRELSCRCEHANDVKESVFAMDKKIGQCHRKIGAVR